MAYDDKEQSVDLGSPITLFEFIYGPGTEDVLRYATVPEAIVLAGRVWSPANMTHSDIVSAGKLDKSEITITCPSTTSVGDLFIAAPPSQQVTLSIWRGHALTDVTGVDDFVRIWVGRVLVPTWNEDELELKCEPVATSAKRVGLRRHYQYGCVHVLYAVTSCKVPQPAHTAQAIIASAQSAIGVAITFTNLPATVTPASLTGGIFTLYLPGGRRILRSITSAVNAGSSWQIRLMSAVPGMANGMTVEVSKGCLHNWDACRAFNNTVNYGGCPNIPTKDPFRTNTF